MKFNIPLGVVWTCKGCGRECRTPAFVRDQCEDLCDGCRNARAEPRPCSLDGEGIYCERGWHWRRRGGTLSTCLGRCPKETQRELDLAAREYAAEAGGSGFADFDGSKQPEMFAAALSWAKGCEGRSTLALVGPVGTGKSHMMRAARFYLTRRGVRPEWISRTSIKLLVNAFGSYGSQIEKERGRWESWLNAGAVLIDDLGQERRAGGRDEETSGVLCDLLDERGAKPLAWASNLDREQLRSRYTEALVSRLFHGAIVPTIQPGDYRSKTV